MRQSVTKEPKVALCRRCRGTGRDLSGEAPFGGGVCPQCEGSGRVTVSCEMTLDIRPYKPREVEVSD